MHGLQFGPSEFTDAILGGVRRFDTLSNHENILTQPNPHVVNFWKDVWRHRVVVLPVEGDQWGVFEFDNWFAYAWFMLWNFRLAGR